ncbi:MAG TPA: hypothetical protein VJQ82_01495 [Terriglobales bacterium]|nr:hypothetical protein [Terriglobales bacterium]
MNTSAVRTKNENERQAKSFIVIHPLDDTPEEKLNTTGMGPMRMTTSVKLSLIALRGYLLLVTILLLYHVLDLSGLLRHWKQ